MKRIFLRTLGLWLSLMAVLTVLVALVSASVQQSYRQGANDPQIQMAEDGAASLMRTYAPAALVPRGSPVVDLSQSLAPWIAVYDASGSPLASTAVLDGAPPWLPAGLFNAASWSSAKTFSVPNGKETRVTWQPRSGIRQAVVLVEFQGPSAVGYVAAGRSLREVEVRELQLSTFSMTAWGAGSLGTLVLVFIFVLVGLV